MRPNVQDRVEKVVMLNKFNFLDWKMEVKLLCLRKQAKTEEEKFAWMFQTLPEGYKRIVLKVAQEEEIKKEDEDAKIYTASLKKLEEVLEKTNVIKEAEKIENEERAKDEIKRLRIEECKYNIEEYYKRFDRAIARATLRGCKWNEEFVKRLFAKGCSGHKDLSSRCDLIHLEEVEDYHGLKIIYDDIIQEKRKRYDNKFKQVHYNRKSGESFYTKGKNKKKLSKICSKIGQNLREMQ